MGAIKGSNLKDICNLAGGMSEGETVQIKATDNFSKTFAYKNVYLYSSREGPMLLPGIKTDMDMFLGIQMGCGWSGMPILL